MTLSSLDWTIIGVYFLLSLAVGIWASKQAGKDTRSFFLAGRNMPWWLLGVSMVATTFSTDTPNLVTDLVRQNGVSGNWTWWAFLVTGMLTVFVYAKLWHRSGVLTDIEFYELRYSGKAAAFLRGFRALYLGLVFNVLVMGAVSLAAIKFGEIVLGLPGWVTLTIACSITLAYSTLGGLKAVIITDFVQFTLAMIGSVWGMMYILGLPQIGGLSNLLTHSNVVGKLALFPDMSDPNVWVPVLLVPLAVQWWASYYPGSEPGGGGYIAQRMFSAKDESNAVSATFLFNAAHYALRPWPWILIALASLVVFPELKDLQSAFPNLPADKLGHDVAYPAMLTLLPSGLLGLVAD
jgi:Na+/proline symporter